MNKTKTAMIVIFLAMMNLATAMPPIASEYFGTVTINSYFAEQGTNVSIYDNDGNLCGSGLVKQEGQFGFISCNGDDISTAQDEGASKGEDVTIMVNGTNAGAASWFEGSINQLEIDVKPAQVKASLPGGILLLPLIPIMAIIAAYFYVSRKI
ncbi:MAG: hypothetical protein V1702_04710 [Candidatus Woesearchaeota archaeon]